MSFTPDPRPPTPADLSFVGTAVYPYACATSAPENIRCANLPAMPTPFYPDATTGQRRKCLESTATVGDVCSYAGYAASIAGLACTTTPFNAAFGVVRDIIKVRHDHVVTNTELAELGFGVAASAFGIVLVPEIVALQAFCTGLEVAKIGLDYCGIGELNGRSESAG